MLLILDAVTADGFGLGHEGMARAHGLTLAAVATKWDKLKRSEQAPAQEMESALGCRYLFRRRKDWAETTCGLCCAVGPATRTESVIRSPKLVTFPGLTVGGPAVPAVHKLRRIEGKTRGTRLSSRPSRAASCKGATFSL